MGGTSNCKQPYGKYKLLCIEILNSRSRELTPGQAYVDNIMKTVCINNNNFI